MLACGTKNILWEQEVHARVLEHESTSFFLQGPLPLDVSLLGEKAIKCRAFAKALHYKEEEFRKGPNTQILEALIR